MQNNIFFYLSKLFSNIILKFIYKFIQIFLVWLLVHLLESFQPYVYYYVYWIYHHFSFSFFDGIQDRHLIKPSFHHLLFFIAITKIILIIWYINIYEQTYIYIIISIALPLAIFDVISISVSSIFWLLIFSFKASTSVFSKKAPPVVLSWM